MSFETLSGATVSRFSFGTMQFGGGADEAESGEMYRACRAAGINFFDTAYGYTAGRSEEILGGLISGERDEVFVATKCGYEGAAPSQVRGEIETSLSRLRVDVIDLLYLHRPDPEVPLEATLEVLAGFAEAGQVRYLGVSNFPAWGVMKARQIAREMGSDIHFIQPMYNLVKRQAEVEILPMAISEGFTVCPYSPLGGGLLTGKYAAGGAGRLASDDRYKERYGLEWMHQTATDLAEYAAVSGASPATLAVAWAARHPGVWGPIISARDTVQLQPSLKAVGFEMDGAMYTEISGLSQTPPPAHDRIEEV